jgi:sugar O-acyltransferase (sialic acid O-acetyltransferase NeuD family)
VKSKSSHPRRTKAISSRKHTETRTRVVVWGAGGHAKVAGEILQLNGFEIAAFIDDENPAREGETFCGTKIFCGADGLFVRGLRKAFIAIGDNFARAQKAQFAEAKGFELISAVHPRAVVAHDVQIGRGSIVMAGAVINPGVTLGANVIVNTLAGVDHDCRIGDSVHICPGAQLAGTVTVGHLTWVGIGATIIDHVTIAQEVIVGAGSVVIDNVQPNVVVAGAPARVIRQRCLA